MTERLHFHFSLSCIGERNVDVRGRPRGIIAVLVPAIILCRADEATFVRVTSVDNFCDDVCFGRQLVVLFPLFEVCHLVLRLQVFCFKSPPVDKLLDDMICFATVFHENGTVSPRKVVRPDFRLAIDGFDRLALGQTFFHKR